MEQWYVLHTKPNRERFVHDGLRSRQIESYLPVWNPDGARARNQITRPYFPCYLFANVDLEVIAISSLQYMPGLRNVVHVDGRPARVDSALIVEIQNRLAEIQDRVLDGQGNPLAQGDRVVVRNGPFQGYEAIFDARLGSHDRVRILIDFLHSRARCEIAPQFLQKVIGAVHSRP